MNLDFPVSDVLIRYTEENIAKLNSPKLVYPWFQITENEFFMEVDEVARYLVRNGNEVLIQPGEKADAASVRLFLAGSAFGALLHQQCILPLHGSSFSYNGKGIVICGTSGAGKSSVVAAFCQNQGQFINDDITPLQIADDHTTIVPINTRLKLWDDTLKKLNLPANDLERIRPSIEKFYLPVDCEPGKEQRFHQLFILHAHNKEEYRVKELVGLEKYNAIRSQVYRRIYLKGMPETEKIYFKQMLKLSAQITVKQVTRPRICSITDTMDFIQKEIDG
jgi:hypothetical protein